MKKYLYFFSFGLIFSCSSDPCDEVTCLNGGTCVDGTCECSYGTYGSSCENALNSIELTELRITGYPAINPNSNQPWDNGPAPDSGYADLSMYVLFGNNIFNIPEASPGRTVKEFCSPTGTHVFTPTVTMSTTNLNSNINLTVWENDWNGGNLLGSEAIDTIYVNFSDFLNNTTPPSVYSVTGVHGVQMEFEFNYVY